MTFTEGSMKAVLGKRTSVLAMALVSSFAIPVFAKPITAVVRLKERVSMDTLALNVQNPYSTHYGIPYTPEEIRQVAAPAQGEYDQTLAQLRQEGFTVVSESPTHLWVTVKAEKKAFELAFATQVQLLGNGLRSHTALMSIPNRFPALAAVHGLDNTRKAFSKMKIAQHQVVQALDSSQPGVSPDAVKEAYGLNPIYSSGITGKGQHIAIATYDDFSTDDVNQFYGKLNLQPGPTVDKVTFNGVAATNNNSAMETELDAEFSGMIAPGASIHVFTSAENSDAGELAMFTAILDDNRAKVVNYSWGACEKQLTPAHQAEMAKVNIVIASGDSGSDSCQDGSVVADWPAANPNVIAVGGTTFSQNHGSIAESGWNGSGGGISGVWELPLWQQALGAPFTKRSYPDVSFNADPSSGQALWSSGSWTVIGGTSMAAPQWSGFLALVGEARQTAGKQTLGFLAPIIYSFNASDKTTLFHDVTSGSNGAYTAAPGWDAVTGWGSMNGSPLLNRLLSN